MKESCAALCVLGMWLAYPADTIAAEPIDESPALWQEDDRGDVEAPEARHPNVAWDAVHDSFVLPFYRATHPARAVRRLSGLWGGDHAPRAVNVNSYDEVPNSSWFTNRIGIRSMTPAEVARGPSGVAGPDLSGPWWVIKAKTEGVTPGFNIRDVTGQVYVLKFDPSAFPAMSSAAGVIGGRLLHAAGYNVPYDSIVYFSRSQLVLPEGVMFRLPDGTRRPMVRADLDRVLDSVDPGGGGTIRALASRFLDGRPLGPFDFRGRRRDDPNDRVNHENRRELRGLAVVAAWIGHFDTKQNNTLDMYVEEDGVRFVRHYLIDFASTLGAAADFPSPRFGYEYGFDWARIARRALSVGFYEDGWRRLQRPEGLPEVGYFESETYDPGSFRAIQPNSAFANLTAADGYWAAKIVSAFTDAQIRAAVSEGQYVDGAAEDHICRILGERRDKTVFAWFERVPPLDHFRADGQVVRFSDLGVVRGFYDPSATRYRYRVADVTHAGTRVSESVWCPVVSSSISVVDGPCGSAGLTDSVSWAPLCEVEVQLNRGHGWSASTRAYYSRTSGRVVSVRR